jgi:putative tricarboxylic transport membrane protein
VPIHPKTRTRRAGVALTFAALALSTAACGGSGATAEGAAAPQLSSLSIIAPAAPGGGWDSTSRAAQGVLEREGLVKSAEVSNIAGAGGTIGLAKLAGMKGKGGTLMTMGLVMVGAVETNKSAATLDDVTPIARLTSEQEAIVVPASSPYTTMDEFVAAWKKDPGKLAIAGGSAGGTDQILAGLLAQAAGIDPKKVNYIAFSGGGEALAAILGGKVSAGISGVSEFTDQIASGKMRALAVSGAERVEGIDAPTAKEAGLDVELENWRGFVAPAGISEADKKALTDAVEQMHASQAWKDEMAKNGWDDAYLPADEFATYLAEEKTRIAEVLADLGLV